METPELDCDGYARSGIMKAVKSVIWLGSSQSDLKAFPPAVVDDMGYQLYLVQCWMTGSRCRPWERV